MTDNVQKKIAIALEYDFKGAPRVTAKGKGHVAETIVELARKHGVIIEENPVLANALSQVELDDHHCHYCHPNQLQPSQTIVFAFVLIA